MAQPTSKRHHPFVFKHNNFGNHGNFGASGIKCIPNTMGSWGHPKDAKLDSKGSSKSIASDKQFKRERSANIKNYDFWNKANKRLTTDEINRRHNTSACMNCGEVGNFSMIVLSQSRDSLRLI